VAVEQPYRGWRDFRWSGSVLSAEDPTGHRWSCGEVIRSNGRTRIEVVDNAGPPNAVLVLHEWRTITEAKAGTPRIFRSLGADFPEPETNMAKTDQILRDLRDHPGSYARDIADRLGLQSGHVGGLLGYAAGLGLVEREGQSVAARWTLTEAGRVRAGTAPRPVLQPTEHIHQPDHDLARATTELLLSGRRWWEAARILVSGARRG
jgi:hypothetical protein